MTHPEETIPEHKDGTEVNVEDSLQLSDEQEAASFFKLVKERLVTINSWGKIAGALSANFTLTNEQGKEIDAFPKTGNYFKIDIPAPGIITGEGYDWVQIEEVKEEKDADSESVAIRVRPAPSPLNDKTDVAHFYTDEATSNFIVKREGTKVTAGVYGRNEKPNVKAETLIDKARNAIVGTGAVSGFSKLQWKALVSGLLERIAK
ncbi:MAG TPA: hypothetical protein VM884_09870 [Flavisolibacter sp.]|jgi:hypothetical protein|nr:hypothetical protein [Flavisolibacter sp.]